MVINFRAKVLFWLSVTALFIGFVWAFSNVLTPFVLGMVIAYLLNPVVTKIARRGTTRRVAAAGIVVFVVLSTLILLALIIPVLARELASLAKDLPGYIEQLMDALAPYIGWAQARLGIGSLDDVQSFITDNFSKVVSTSGGLLGGLAVGSKAAAGVITTLVLTPLVTYYMLDRWPVIVDTVEDLYPRDKEAMLEDLFRQIDRKLAGFIRGQLMVALCLGIGYAIALTIAGLKYGILIGLGAGLLSIIPFVGSTLGLLTSVGVAYFQSGGEWSYVGIIAGIFLLGQFIEGNILSPKLLGDGVGLHPLWILFALMAGGSLFGIVGMLLAVPVAAVIGVLVSFAIQQYKKSPLYNDTKNKQADISEE